MLAVPNGRVRVLARVDLVGAVRHLVVVTVQFVVKPACLGDTPQSTYRSRSASRSSSSSASDSERRLPKPRAMESKMPTRGCCHTERTGPRRCAQALRTLYGGGSGHVGCRSTGGAGRGGRVRRDPGVCLTTPDDYRVSPVNRREIARSACDNEACTGASRKRSPIQSSSHSTSDRSAGEAPASDAATNSARE